MNGVAGYAGAIVNPSLTLAIESTRQFLKGAATGAGSDAWPFDHLPNWPASDGWTATAIDDAEQLIKWQPDVRATVLGFEAMSAMSFSAVSPDGGELGVWGKSMDDKAPRPYIPLARISRPGIEVLRQQARRVADQSQFRLMPKSDDLATRDRLTEITSQVVPPFAFWCAALPMHPDRMPRTIELIDLTLTLASFTVQRFKHALAVPRANQLNPTVFPAILTPAHASLPSGHATEAFAVANVLMSLLSVDVEGDLEVARQARNSSTLGRRMLALAARIADNRQVAGLHYPIDTLAGRLLGTVLSGYLVARCTGTSCQTGVFDGANLKTSTSNDGSGLSGGADNASLSVDEPDIWGQGLAQGDEGLLCRLVDPGAGNVIPKSDSLEWLWYRARAEWGATPKESK